MTEKSDWVRFVKAMSDCFLGTVRRVPTDQEMDGCWDVLKDLRIEQVEAGFFRARKQHTSEFRPPADGKVRQLALLEDSQPEPWKGLPPVSGDPWPAPSPEMAARVEKLKRELVERKWPGFTGGNQR